MGLSRDDWAVISRKMDELALAAGQRRSHWFIQNLCWVNDERPNPPVKRKFKAEFVQQRFLDEMWCLSVVLKARQHGISLCCAMLMLYYSLARMNHRAGISDFRDEDGVEKLKRIKFAYDHLDDPDDPNAAIVGRAIKQAIPLVRANEHELVWANGSSVRVSKTFTGGTLNFFWVSELGKIAMEDPIRAKEIARGSINAVHPGNIIILESTHRGGRTGLNYDMIRLARKSPPQPSKMQWKFLFFGWQENPKYSIDLPANFKATYPDDLIRYFADLEQKTGKTLTEGQKYWYLIKTTNSPRSEMPQEFPGTPEEALRAASEGAIYADQISLLRARGRITDLTCDGTAPIYTFWDIGSDDASGIWLLQMVGFDIHALNFSCGNGKSPAQHAATLLEWERKYDRPISGTFLPHDAAQRDNIALSWKAALAAAGIKNMVVVPRTPDVWVGINHLRELLPRFRFHETNCEREFEMGNGVSWPSGVGALEGYRKEMVADNGVARPVPVHDACESGASSLRTFAEAHARGLLRGPSPREIEARRAVAGPQRAIMGLARPGVVR